MDGVPFIPERSEGEGWCPPYHEVRRRTKARGKTKSEIMFSTYILLSIDHPDQHSIGITSLFDGF